MKKNYNLSVLIVISLVATQSLFAGECEDKHPPEKIIKEQIIETPYEVVIETPIEIAYWVTIKKPVQVVETCFKKVAKDIWKKPWKLVTVWVDVPYQCTKTIYEDVKEQRFKTELKREVVTRIKTTVKKIEEYKRPAGYIACLSEKSVHDLRDLTIELVTGEDPDKAKAEIQRMLAECQARTEELTKLNNYLRLEDNYRRNGGHFESYMPTVAALATYYGGPYGAAASLAVYGIYAGIDHKIKEIKKEYENTVAVCQESYNRQLNEMKAVVEAQERKIAVNRNKVLAQIDLLQKRIDLETKNSAMVSKQIIEQYLSRSVSDEEMVILANEHQNLIQTELDKLDLVLKEIVIEIAHHNEILSNLDLLLNYSGE